MSLFYNFPQFVMSIREFRRVFVQIILSESHQQSCEKVSTLIIGMINSIQYPVLGLATGGTVEPIYASLVEAHHTGKVSFQNVLTVNLDEYLGLEPTHSQSYRYFMNKFLFNHVDINIDNTYVPVGNINPESALSDFQSVLLQKARDFQLLGVGANGHIAFNEPAASLHSSAHIVSIADSTVKANARYFDNESDVPRRAFTQGMGDILRAKKIVLVATGDSKINAMKTLLMDDLVSSNSPCTYLKLHPDVTIFIDHDLAIKVGYEG